MRESTVTKRRSIGRTLWQLKQMNTIIMQLNNTVADAAQLQISPGTPEFEGYVAELQQAYRSSVRKILRVSSTEMPVRVNSRPFNLIVVYGPYSYTYHIPNGFMDLVGLSSLPAGSFIQHL